MGYYHVTGFPLDRRDMGENEVQLTLYTLERGKIRITVRGTKKPDSSLRPALTPLNEGHYFITERRTSDLLKEWEPVRTFRDIRKDLDKLALAGYFARFILEFAPSGGPDRNIYNLLGNIYFLFCINIKHDIIKTLYEWGFLRAMGLAPEINGCALCGENPETGFFWFDITEGELACSTCRPKSVSRSARLSLRAKKFGSGINNCCDILLNENADGGEASPETMETVLKKLQSFKYEDRAAFAGATAGFCRWHLSENVAEWLLKF